jgi:hypothetical protein
MPKNKKRGIEISHWKVGDAADFQAVEPTEEYPDEEYREPLRADGKPRSQSNEERLSPGYGSGG